MPPKLLPKCSGHQAQSTFTGDMSQVVSVRHKKRSACQSVVMVWLLMMVLSGSDVYAAEPTLSFDDPGTQFV